MKKAGMVLEGGGTRGVFTAGVLDYFMEQGMYLPYVIGVSAGACNAVDYASHQPGRMKLCTIDFLEAGSYVGLKSLVKTHSLFNMDLIFDIFPNKIIPFDYDTYFSSGMECILTATNALTGKAEYLSEKSDRQRLMTICRLRPASRWYRPLWWWTAFPWWTAAWRIPCPFARPCTTG